MMPDAQNRYDLLKGAFEELQTVSRWDATLLVAVNFCKALGVQTTVDFVQTAVLPAEKGQTAVFLIGDTGYSMVLTTAPSLDDEQQTLLQMFAGWLASCPLFQKRRVVLTAFDEAEIAKNVQQFIAPLREIQTLDETLDQMIQSLVSTFAADIGFIALYHLSEQLIRFERVYEENRLVAVEPVHLLDETSLTSWVVLNGQPYFSGQDTLEQRPTPGFSVGLTAKAIMVVPLVYDQEILGAVSVQRVEDEAYTAHHFTMLTMLATELALILRNAGVFQQTKELVDKSTADYLTAVALRQAIAVVGTSLDKERVLNNLLMAIAGVMLFDVSLIYVAEEETLRLAAGYDYCERPIPILFNDADVEWEKFPLLQTVIQERSPLLIEDVQEDVRWIAYEGSEEAKGWLGIPLLVGQRVLGVLVVIRHGAAQFDKREIWLASTLASHGAIALQNALTQQQTERQLDELNTLYQATATMSANLDQDFVLQSVAEEMIRALQVDTCTIFVWDSVSNTLLPVAHKNQVYPEERPLTGDDPTETIGLSQIDNLSNYEVVQRIFKRQEAYTVRRDNAISSEQQQLLDISGLQSVLLLPLVQRNDVLGLLALGQVYRLRTIEQRRLGLAQNLAGQAAVAIDHARLFAQAKRRVSELSTFHSIVLHLNTPLNLNAVLDTITESALKLVDASNLHIYLYNARTDSFTLGAALQRNGDRKPAVSSPRKNGITHEVVRTGREIVVNRAFDHPLWQTEDAKSWGIYAIAGFPIKQGSDVIGAFTATYQTPHTFTEDELLLLNLLSDHAAVAVKNARLFEESERRFREMSALVELAKQVTSSLSLQEVLQTTVDTLRKLLNARASTITMFDDDKTELILMAGSGVNQEYIRKVRLQLGEGVSGTVVRRGEPIYIADTHKEPNFLAFSDQVRSLLVVPLTNREEVIGTMTIDSNEPDAFADSSIQLMTIAALQVSVAIVNARMFEELQKGAAELALAYEELKENDRMKEELVQNLSHELRTPLTFVKGYVDLLMEGEIGELTDEQRSILSIVNMKTDEITRLIDDIVTLQRIEASNLEKRPVDLRKVIEETLIPCRLMAEERGLQIVFSAPESPMELFLDYVRINQVLNNLLVNAIKFSPNGGRIMVELIENAFEVEVRIMDEGIGLPQDKVGRIFDRFYQVDGSVRRKYGGTGLGLAIVKRIIDAHGGRVWAEARPNSGSLFTFVLPKPTPVPVIEP